MSKKIKRFSEIKNFKPDEHLDNFKYQKKLTDKLDKIKGKPLTQRSVEQIVLWKVNRYAELDARLLKELNALPATGSRFSEKQLAKILDTLLVARGVRIAMASSILRFYNPQAFQIMDQRVFRFIYGHTMQAAIKADGPVKVYIRYLRDLRRICGKTIPFEQADRIFYEADKVFNEDIPLSGF